MSIGCGQSAKSGVNSDITSLSGLTTALSIEQGGTGAKTAANARAALGARGPTVYQADEVLTGDTWIDGKPIYRKIVEYTGSTTGINIVIDAALTLAYISTLIALKGSIKHASGHYNPNWYGGTNSLWEITFYTDGMRFYAGSNFVGSHTAKIIVEYTKA